MATVPRGRWTKYATSSSVVATSLGTDLSDNERPFATWHHLVYFHVHLIWLVESDLGAVRVVVEDGNPPPHPMVPPRYVFRDGALIL